MTCSLPSAHSTNPNRNPEPNPSLRACKHLYVVTTAELKHGLVVRRVRGDVVEVLAPTKADGNGSHARPVQLRPQRVGPVKDFDSWVPFLFIDLFVYL